MSASPDDVRASAAEFWDPDADFYPVPKFPDSEPCHGLNEISRFFSRFRDTWFRYEMPLKEVIEVDDERLLARSTLRAEGRESGVNLEGDMYQCVWFRHGRFLRVEHHLTLKGALHGLGLRGDTLEAAGLRTPSNLDLVRSILAAWERGDYSSAEWADPEIEFVIADGPAPGRWTGLAGMAEGAREELSAWEGYRGEVDEYRELDNERVLVFHRFRARGKQSGLELEGIQTEGASLFHIRDGKVTKLLRYWNRQGALADLGLVPRSTTSADA
jgi:ketosteroid isomerase-like protein